MTDAAPAGSETPGAFVISGQGNSYVDFTLSFSSALAPVLTTTEADQASPVGTTTGSYVGYYIMRLPSFEPVTGYVQVTAFEDALGGPGTVRLVGGQQTDLAAGRYRIVLLGDAPSTVRIHTRDRTEDVHLNAATPHPTAGGSFGEFDVSTGEFEERSLTSARVERGSTIFIGTQLVFDDEGQRSSESCLNLRDEGPDCPSDGVVGGTNFLETGTGAGRQSLTGSLTLPSDDRDPGVYNHQLTARSVSRSDMTVRHLFLTVGPGPQEQPILPFGEDSNNTSTGAVRSRDLVDACRDADPANPSFSDVSGDTHEAEIACAALYGIVTGRTSGAFEPAAAVTRAQAASILARLIETAGGELRADPPNAFSDDTGSVHESRINQLAEAGVVSGDAGGRYLPYNPVTRAQMATLIHKAYSFAAGLPLISRADRFTDDNNNVHEANINALAQNGIVTGRRAQTYDPVATVSRGAAAAWMARTTDLLVEIGRISSRR